MPQASSVTRCACPFVQVRRDVELVYNCNCIQLGLLAVHEQVHPPWLYLLWILWKPKEAGSLAIFVLWLCGFGSFIYLFYCSRLFVVAFVFPLRL